MTPPAKVSQPSYDGGCGDPECELCKADAEAALTRRKLMEAVNARNATGATRPTPEEPR